MEYFIQAIPSTNVTVMMIVAVVCILGPLLAAVIAAVRFRTGPMPILMGVLVYVMAQLLVRTPLLNLVFSLPGFSAFMETHPVWNDFLLSFTTAVVEELARWAAFLFVMKQRYDDHNAIAYGIGHGGAEVILTAGFAYVGYYFMAQSVNVSFNTTVDPEFSEQLMIASENLLKISPRDMFLTIIMQAAAVCMHVLYSFLIVRGIMNKSSVITVPLAIAAHFFYLLLQSLLTLLPEGIIWKAFFSGAVATCAVYYLLEARRRAVMAEYERKRK
ncbi:MAG: YhfC family intramembrane metalloprotease [Ruminococcaceae bacterium]|nr:YhfC family intramembrane metalloprotease [Oscillospiraceae bacterium]